MFKKKTDIIPQAPPPAPPPVSGRNRGLGLPGCLIVFGLVLALGWVLMSGLGQGIAYGGGSLDFNFEPRAFSDNITATSEEGDAIAFGRNAEGVSIVAGEPNGNQDESGRDLGVLPVLCVVAPVALLLLFLFVKGNGGRHAWRILR